MGMETAEVVVIGAGIAGATIAYHLAQAGCTDVLVLEREETPGYHATGRSAAVFTRMTEDDVFVRLSVLSAPFFRTPPEGFSEVPLLRPNGTLMVAQGARLELLRTVAALARRVGIESRVLSPEQAVQKVPALERRFLDGGVLFPEDGLLDVHAILWGYIGAARRAGVRLRVKSEVTAVRIEGGRVAAVETRDGPVRCRWLVDAAGAWANRVAAMAGARPLPLTPCRRHIVVVRPASAIPVDDWPLTTNQNRHFYFRPESGAILVSPMDQDPMEPCDARPDEFRVAQAADLLSRFAPAIAPGRIVNKWAGLRTIAADRAPVVGEDPSVKGFFWLAGQAGHGINTSPALGRIAAELLLQGTTNALEPALIHPTRFYRGRFSVATIAARRAWFLARWLARGPVPQTRS